MTKPERVSDVVGAQVKAHRIRLGLTREQLAERCVDLGADNITASVLVNLESGRPDKAGVRRRDVTVDEWLLLAYALDVPPLVLLLPSPNGHPIVQLTPKTQVAPADTLNWLTAEKPPRDFDEDRKERWSEGASELAEARIVNSYVNRLREFQERRDTKGYMDFLRELARTCDFLAVTRNYVPVVEEEHLNIMLEQGWLDHPDKVVAAFRAQQANEGQGDKDGAS